MFNRFIISLFILCIFNFNVSARDNNPFAKTESLNIGKDVIWKIDKEAVQASKTINDGKGTYYHLRFDNKQLELLISSDAKGLKPKKFNQLEVKNVIIDGQQNPLFRWCLNNQQRHNRFLQQGLKVSKNICTVNGEAGSFVMHLNKSTLLSLQQGAQLLILLKPFRTPLELHYDIRDFKTMYITLNAKPEPVAVVETPAQVVVEKPESAIRTAKKKCWARPPEKYKNIKSVEYGCDNAKDKKDAEVSVRKQVDQNKARQQKLEAEREKQQKLAERNKQKELAEKRKQEELLQAEAAAIAASEAKQAAIGDEIAVKMVKFCEKFWSKGEHRCYCQKYIDYAPSDIQANSTCN
jgi:hypothetical protein